MNNEFHVYLPPEKKQASVPPPGVWLEARLSRSSRGFSDDARVTPPVRSFSWPVWGRLHRKAGEQEAQLCGRWVLRDAGETP